MKFRMLSVMLCMALLTGISVNLYAGSVGLYAQDAPVDRDEQEIAILGALRRQGSPAFILDIDEYATQAEAKAAYSNWMKRNHPDRVKNDALKADAALAFQKIKKAYEAFVPKQRPQGTVGPVSGASAPGRGTLVSLSQRESEVGQQHSVVPYQQTQGQMPSSQATAIAMQQAEGQMPSSQTTAMPQRGATRGTESALTREQLVRYQNLADRGRVRELMADTILWAQINAAAAKGDANAKAVLRNAVGVK